MIKKIRTPDLEIYEIISLLSVMFGITGLVLMISFGEGRFETSFNKVSNLFSSIATIIIAHKAIHKLKLWK